MAVLGDVPGIISAVLECHAGRRHEAVGHRADYYATTTRIHGNSRVKISV